MDDSGTSIGKVSAQEAPKKSHTSAASQIAGSNSQVAAVRKEIGKVRVSGGKEGAPPAKRQRTGDAPTSSRNAQTRPQPPPAQTPTVPPPPATVVIPSNIRHPSTPAAMVPNRIPPRVNTSVSVTVNGMVAGSTPVRFFIGGGNASNGTVTINGANDFTANANGTSTLNLSGVTQTSPGSASNLHLTANQGTTQLGNSNGFSVSSIPQNWLCTQLTILNTPANPASEVGFIVQDHWDSDSGDVTDLGQADISELIENTTATGIFAGAIHHNSGYLAGGSATFSTDTHSAGPRSALRRIGNLVQNQTSKFRDNRTGAVDIPVKNSGYSITHVISPGASATSFLYTLAKNGAALTAHGITSAAGSGSITPPAFNVP